MALLSPVVVSGNRHVVLPAGDALQLPGAFASIYVTGGASGQAVTTANTYERFNGLVTNGVAVNATADAANRRLRALSAGTYVVAFNCSFSGTANKTFAFRLRNATQGTFVDQCRAERKMNAAGDVGNLSFVGLVAVAANDYLEVWYTTLDTNGDSVTAIYGSFGFLLVGT